MGKHYHIWTVSELVNGRVAAYRSREHFKHRTQAYRVAERYEAGMMVLQCDGFKCDVDPLDPVSCQS